MSIRPRRRRGGTSTFTSERTTKSKKTAALRAGLLAANPRIVLGYDAYFGTYTVDDAAGTITHRVVGSLFPEDLGKDFVRLFTLDGDTLTLKFTSIAAGSEITRTLVFRRAS